MEYKKVQDQEMQQFDPVVDYKPPPKPFDDRDDDKERRNKSKEKRISISLVILTFLASVCVLFGTLFPELSRGEINMVPYRKILMATNRIPEFIIRDRITLVNLGLWRYCYDDQLYDLVEQLTPGGYRSNIGRKKRDTEDLAEDDEVLSLEKRQVTSNREGDIAIRCHPVPEPYKMPYHVKNKTEATKICLIIGIVTCILSFLISILVLITRLPILKFVQLITCFAGVVAMGTSCGLLISVKDDAQWYFNEAVGRASADFLRDEFGWDIEMMSINLKSANTITLQIGVSGVFIIASTVLMLVSTLLGELSRNI